MRLIMSTVHAHTKMVLCSSEESMAAIHRYHEKHGDHNFNGITYAALSEIYGTVIHVLGRGFFRPDKRTKRK
jgi:hypothetical protein